MLKSESSNLVLRRTEMFHTQLTSVTGLTGPHERVRAPSSGTHTHTRPPQPPYSFTSYSHYFLFMNITSLIHTYGKGKTVTWCIPYRFIIGYDLWYTYAHKSISVRISTNSIHFTSSKKLDLFNKQPININLRKIISILKALQNTTNYFYTHEINFKNHT